MRTLDQAFEIVVVDDGSGDWTCEEARKAARQAPHPGATPARQPGQGPGPEGGFPLLPGPMGGVFGFRPRHQPGPAQAFLRHSTLLGTDVVIDSKQHPDSKLDYPLKRRIVSAGYFFLVKLLFRLPIRDT